MSLLFRMLLRENFAAANPFALGHHHPFMAFPTSPLRPTPLNGLSAGERDQCLLSLLSEQRGFMTLNEIAPCAHSAAIAHVLCCAVFSPFDER